VLAMLAQPVHRIDRTSHTRRCVAILLDDSSSMRIPDRQLPPAEMVRLGEALLEDAPGRTVRLEECGRLLQEAEALIQRELTWLASRAEVAPAPGTEPPEARRTQLQRAVQQASERTTEAGSVVAAAARNGLTGVEDVRKALDAAIRQIGRLDDMLKAAEQLAAAPETDAAAAADALRRVAEAAAPAIRAVAAAGRALDDAFFASLPPAAQDKVRTVAQMTRLEIARSVLLGRSASDDAQARPFLLDLLARDYDVRAFRFASSVRELPATSLSGSEREADSDGAGEAAAPGAETNTDLAAALAHVSAEIPTDELAGIVVLTDGLHNAPERPEVPARRLGRQGVPVCSVVVGGADPPRDAAVLSVDAPEAVFQGDRVHVKAWLKLDGLAGEKARVVLSKDGETLDSASVAATEPMVRTHVELSHAPSDTGMQAYAVSIERFPDETFTDNNMMPTSVSVTDERTKLLIVESRPRWEFRYLKNLFAARDRTVSLQYVLLHAERIAGVPEPEPEPASVSRSSAQAFALPADEEQWLAFDVIMLGDVAPDALRTDARDALRRFVVDHGGTLVVIAGPNHMPHAFADTVFEELLPVRFAGEEGYIRPPEESYRLALTPDGLDSVMMRQDSTAEGDPTGWEAMPELHWRHPVREAKPGSVVLAYALAPGEEPDEALARARPLIVTQNVGLGRVLFLAFDRTWRLRYRAGDRYHHRFWGQVLRWATAGKLPSGTRLVRLGSDRWRYPAGAHVRIRARLLQPDLSPLPDAELAAMIYRDGVPVLRRRLLPATVRAGMYEADLGALAGGLYRVELEGPKLPTLLAEEGADGVSVGFEVGSAPGPELAVLAADFDLPARLAQLSGGAAVRPAEAELLVDLMGDSVIVTHDRREYALWSSWPMLAAIMALAAAEWIIRKKVGLP